MQASWSKSRRCYGLLGIDGLKVVDVEVDADGGRVVHAVTDASVPPACPKCGVVSTSPRGQARARRV